MCGRFALYSPLDTLARHFQTDTIPGMEITPRYNIAPSQNVAVIRDEGGTRRFALVHWGLIPSWAKEQKIGYRMINARAETVAEKPAFRTAFKYRRCLVPADGYYEWQAIVGANTKQPWFIALKNRAPMAFAGLWEKWKTPDGGELESCTIIVTEANDFTRSIHDRMPVILEPKDWDSWLEPKTENDWILQSLLKPYPDDAMTAWPVSAKVNSPRNDLEECVEAVG
ncbi:MAG: SOS response-associated peptidase [Gammaproteobacteria bacterium]